jgi:SAM-dependent methyltransferase
MVENYNLAARELGFSETQMYAVQGDLMEGDGSLSGEEFFNFDLVAICMALHHLADPHEAVKRLVARLRVGGVLVITDWAATAEKDCQKNVQWEGRCGNGHDDTLRRHPAAHTIAHLNFAKGEIETVLEHAECNAVDFVLHAESSTVPMAPGGKMRLFFARATKAGVK